MELTPVLEASIKDQLSQNFLDACSDSHERETLAELVYNTAIQNSSVKKAEGDLEQQLTIFQQVLIGLGTKVNLDGSWFPFGGEKAETLGAIVSMGSSTQSYVGKTSLKINGGHKPVGANAIWISIN
jgi:hypothetical protein